MVVVVEQGQRSRASSNLSDVIEQGFYHEDEHYQKPSSAKPEPLQLENSNCQVKAASCFASQA